MEDPSGGRSGTAFIAAVAFSVFCWICLYAAFADFAQAGFSLLARPSGWHGVAGAALVALHALGLLLLFVMAGGALALIVSETPPEGVEDRVNGTFR